MRPWSQARWRIARVRVKGDSDWQRVSIRLPQLKNHVVLNSGQQFLYNFLDIRFLVEGTGEARVAEVKYCALPPSKQ